MSSILKALKKLEDEKIARKPDSLRIDAEILHENTAPRFSLLGIALLAALLFVCGSAATYFYMKPQGTKIDVATAKPSAPSPPTVPTLTPTPTVPAIPQEHIVADDIVPAAAAPQAHKAPRQPVATAPATKAAAAVQSKAERPSPAVKPSHKQIAEALPARSVLQPAASRLPSAAPVKQATMQVERPAANAAPSLRVNGIAFQDGIDSVAMINGIPASKGSVIEGARIEDIQRDRVLFSYGGRNFEIGLGKSNR